MKLYKRNDKSEKNSVALLLRLMDCNDLEGTGEEK